VLHWLGTTNSNWGTAANWLENAAPASGDTLVFDTTTTGFAGTVAAFAPFDDLPALTGLSLGFVDASAAGDFAVSGNAFGLAGGTALTAATSAGTGPSVANAITLGANATVAVGLGTLTLSGAVGGGFGLTVNGAAQGTVALTGANGYTGDTTVTSGIVSVGTASALGAGTLTLAGGALTSPGGTVTLANPVTVSAAGVIGGAGTLTLTGLVTLDAGLTLTHAGTLILAGKVTGNAGLTQAAPTGTTVLAGTVTNNFFGGLTVIAGTVSLQKSSGFAVLGLTTLYGGTLSVGADNQVSTLGVVLGAGATLATNGHNVSLDTLRGAGTLDTGASAAGTVTINTGASFTYTGTITGAGVIRYTGTDMYTLAGSGPAFTGRIVSAASAGSSVLKVNGNYPGATLETAAGSFGTAGGTGVVKAVTAPAASFRPGGPGVGVLTTAAGGASALTGATVVFDLNTPTPTDQLVVGAGATLSLAGTLSVTAPVTPTGVSKYTLITSPTGGISGVFSGAPNGGGVIVGSVTYTITYSAFAVTLTNPAAATPSALHWTGAAGSNWGTAGNWAEGVVPTGNQTVVFDTTTPGFAGTAAAFAPNNDLTGLTGMSVLVVDNSAAGDFAVTGTGIGLSSAATPVVVASVTAGARATLTVPLTLTAATSFLVGQGTLTLAGAVGGAAGTWLATDQASTGTLELTAANTYAGDTVVFGGTLAVGSGAAIGTGPLTLAGGTLAVPAGAVTITNPVTVSSPSTLTGAGALTLTGTVNLTSPLTSTNAAAVTLSGAVSGSGSFVQNSPTGVTTFSGTAANTFSGGVTVVSGTVTLQKSGGANALICPVTLLGPGAVLTVGADNQMNGNVALTMNPGSTLDLNPGGNPHADNILSLNGAYSTSQTATIKFGTSLSVVGGGTQSYAGTITGPGFLYYIGTGSLALTGSAPSYTGTAYAAAGTLAVDGSFPAAQAQAIGGTLTGTGVVKSVGGSSGSFNPGRAGAGGVLSTAGVAATSNLGSLAVQVDLSTTLPTDQLVGGSGATLNLNNAALSVNVLGSALGRVFTIASSPTGGITGTFAGKAEGTVFAAGGRNFQIHYTTTAVTLTDVAVTTFHWTGAAGSNWGTAGNWAENAVPTSGATLIFDTATAGFAGTAAAFAPVNNLSGLTGLTLTLNDASAAGDFNLTGNAIGLAAGGLTAAVGTGTKAGLRMPLTLPAATAFTISPGAPVEVVGLVSGSGGITLGGGGTLSVGQIDPMSSPNTQNTYTGNTVVNAGTLMISASDFAFGTGTLFLNGTAASPVVLRPNYDAILRNNTVVTGAGNSVVGSSGLNVYGTTTLNDTLTINDSFVVSFVGPGVATGPGGLRINDPAGGVVQFAVQSTYTGTTTVTGGIMQVWVDSTATAGPFGNPASAVLALNGGTLHAMTAARTVGNPFTVGGAATVDGSLGLIFTGNGTLSTALAVTNTATTTFSGALGGTAGLTVNTTGTVALAGTAANTATGTTTVTAGTLTLNKTAGVDAVAGPLSVAAGATAKLLAANQVNDAAALTVNGTLDPNGFADTVGSLAGSGAVNLSAAGSALGVGSGSFGGTFSGGGGLTKVGAGTLTLTGGNAAFTGTTAVTAGTLAVNGAFSASPVTVTGGTLAGTGTVKSVAATGGTVSPAGAGTVGALSTAAGAFASSLNGATFQADLTGPAAADELALGAGATINLTGGTLSVTPTGSATGNTYTILTSPSNGISGTFAGLAGGSVFAAGGRTFQIAYSPSAVTLTDVPAPTLGVANTSATVGTSGTTPLSFTVTLSAASATAVTVNYATADGTAAAPGDYAATSGTLTFGPGVTTQTITVQANGNPLFTPSRQFTVTLSTPSGATVATGTATGTINYSAPAPAVSVANTSATVGTSGTTLLTFTVTLSAASNATTTVNYATANGTATAPADYAATSGTLTFTPGQISKTVTVLANGTATYTLPKQFTVTLSSPSNATVGTGTATGTINYSAPAPALSIANAAATVGTSGTTPLSFTVTLSAASNATTTVNFATANGTAAAPGDYAATSGTLTFTPGQTSKTVTVQANGSAVFNTAKQFTVTLSSPSNATVGTGTATGTINYPAPAPEVGVGNTSGTQPFSGTSTVTFTVTLSAASGATTTVNYATANGTATAGTDYTATSGTLTFAPGQTSKPVTVTVLGNPFFAAGRTFTLTLSGPSNATLGTATGTATLTSQLVPANVTPAGGGGQSAAVGTGFAAPLVVQVTDQLSHPVAGVTVTFAGPASGAGVTFPGGATAVTGATGLASVFVAANGTGGSYTVTATVATASLPAAFTLTNTVPPLPPPPPPAGRPLAVSGAADGTARLLTPSGGKFTASPSLITRSGLFGDFAGDVRAAAGDFNGDGVTDTVMVTGPGTKTVMAVVSGKDGSVLVPPTDPFGDANFTYGGFVAAGDIDHDGRAEWVVTPELKGGPRVIIFHLLADGSFDLGRGSLVANFFGIGDPGFRDGDRAALGDVNGDGILDVFSIAAFNGGPRTALYDGKDVLGAQAAGRDPVKLVGDFFAATSGQDDGRGGRSIAAGDVNGDGVADLIVTGDNLLGTGNRVTVYSGADLAAGRLPGAGAAVLADFAVSGQPGEALLSVAAVDADGDNKEDVAVGSGAGQPSRVKVYLGKDVGGGAEPAAAEFDPFGGAAPGGVFVG
jgi:autotransporter-associated beta strand protein